jgi:hypothetical protein
MIIYLGAATTHPGDSGGLEATLLSPHCLWLRVSASRPQWDILSNTWQATTNTKQLVPEFGAPEFHIDLVNYDVTKIPT